MTVKANPTWLTANKKDFMLVTEIHGTRKEVDEYVNHIGKMWNVVAIECIDGAMYDMEIMTDNDIFFVVLSDKK